MFFAYFVVKPPAQGPCALIRKNTLGAEATGGEPGAACVATVDRHADAMSLARPWLDRLDPLIDRLLCVAGAGLFSQAPEFFQQYLQRLGGHLDEARRQLDLFRQTATAAGLSLDQLIAHATASADRAVAPLGEAIHRTAARVDTLQAAHDALLHASAWTRPFVFLAHLDPGIVGATWAVYRPAVPTTLEGLAYALIGLLVFLAVYHCGVRRLWAREAKPKAGAASSAGTTQT